MIHIWSEGAIKEPGPVTLLRVEGHPLHTCIPVADEALKGWNGYMLELYGYEVDEPRPGAPYWWPQHEQIRFILELRSAAAWRPPAPAMAFIRWEPGAALRQSIEVTSDTWNDRDLRNAGQALKLLHGLSITHRRGEQSPDVRVEYLDAARKIAARGDEITTSALAEETFRSFDRTKKRMAKHGVTTGGLKKALRST